MKRILLVVLLFVCFKASAQVIVSQPQNFLKYIIAQDSAMSNQVISSGDSSHNLVNSRWVKQNFQQSASSGVTKFPLTFTYGFLGQPIVFNGSVAKTIPIDTNFISSHWYVAQNFLSITNAAAQTGSFLLNGTGTFGTQVPSVLTGYQIGGGYNPTGIAGGFSTGVFQNQATPGMNTAAQYYAVYGEGGTAPGASNTYSALNSLVGVAGSIKIRSGATITGSTSSLYAVTPFYTGAGNTAIQNGLYIAPQFTPNGTTLAYGINAPGQFDNHYFAGNVGIQTASPTANFHVSQGTTGIGAAAKTSGSPTITGYFTQFLNTFRAGDNITIGGETKTITAIASNTSLTVSDNFSSTSTISAPTGVVGSVTTGGSTLSPGTYYYVVTSLNGSGETIQSIEVTIVLATGQIPQIKWNPVIGATSYHIYRGITPGGENVFVNTSNLEIFSDTGFTGTSGTPPVSNTATGPTTYTLSGGDVFLASGNGNISFPRAQSISVNDGALYSGTYGSHNLTLTNPNGTGSLAKFTASVNGFGGYGPTATTPTFSVNWLSTPNTLVSGLQPVEFQNELLSDVAPTVSNDVPNLGYLQSNYYRLLTPTSVQTSNYTATANQLVYTNTTSGSITVTLPNTPANGTLMAVKMIILGVGNTTTITTAGSDVFNKTGGSTSLSLSLVNQGQLMQYNSGIWTVLSDDVPLGGLDARYAQLAAATNNFLNVQNVGSQSGAATLYLYGTSLGAKYGYNGTWQYSDNYGYKLAQNININFVNNSQSGKTLQAQIVGTNSIYQTIGSFPTYTPGSLMMLEMGINDADNADTVTFNTTTYTTQANAVITNLKSIGWPAANIIIETAFYWTAGSSTRAHAYVAANAAIAAANGTKIIDGYDAYMSLVPGTYTLASGLHPPQPAHTLIAYNDAIYLSSFVVNNSRSVLNTYESATVSGALNSTGTANLSGNTTINNLKLNIGRLIAGNVTGDIYARDTSGYSINIPDPAVGQVFMSGGVGLLPAWTANPSISGTLGVAGATTLSNTLSVNGSISGLTLSSIAAGTFAPTINFAQNSAQGYAAIFSPTSTPGTGFLTATLTTPGTGYVTGTYTNVPLVNISGSGSGAVATVVVAGGAVTSVTVSGGGGVNYAIGNTFTFAAGFDGGSSTNFVGTVLTIGYTGNVLSAARFALAPILLSPISTPSNLTAGQLWVTSGTNHLMAFLNGVSTQIDLSSGTTGSVPFYNSSGVLTQNNAKFFWNNTAFQMGLQTATTNSLLTLGSGGTTATRAVIGFNDATNAATNGALIGLATGSSDLVTGAATNDVVFRSAAHDFWWSNGATSEMHLTSAGALTVSKVNGNTFTAGTYTLTGAAGKTLTFNNSITLAGTDATTMTFPSASTNVVGNPNGALNILASTQTTLVAGTKALSITGVTTGSHAYVTLVTASGTSLTTQYQAVATSGTVTITANIAAGTINTSDISTVNVFVTN